MWFAKRQKLEIQNKDLHREGGIENSKVGSIYNQIELKYIMAEIFKKLKLGSFFSMI